MYERPTRAASAAQTAAASRGKSSIEIVAKRSATTTLTVSKTNALLATRANTSVVTLTVRSNCIVFWGWLSIHPIVVHLGTHESINYKKRSR